MIQRFLLYVFLLALWLTVALRRKFHSWWRCRIPSCGRSCWRHCSLGSNTESFRKQVSLAAHFQVEGISAISWKMRISECSIDSFWKKNEYELKLPWVIKKARICSNFVSRIWFCCFTGDGVVVVVVVVVVGLVTAIELGINGAWLGFATPKRAS